MDARLVLEGEEDVVLRYGALAPRIELRVQPARRAEELQRLIDEVAAQVEEQPPALRRNALPPSAAHLRAPALEARLEPVHTAELVRGQQPPQRQEVPVPAPVLKHRQQQPALGSRIDEPAPFGRIQRERLVDDDRELGLESRQPERNVAAVRRRDHGQIELARPLPDLVSRPDHGHAGVLAERLLAALAVAGHDHGQLQARCRGDERRVEDGTG